MHVSVVVPVLVLAPLPAFAHGDGADGLAAPGLVILAAALVAAAHARGAAAQWPRRTACLRAAVFCVGLLVLVSALIGPLSDWAERSLAGHMVQHAALLLLAPPLLLLGQPLAAFLRALPVGPRRKAARMAGARVRSSLAHPVLAALLQAGVVSAWHIPGVFIAAAGNAFLHEAEHLSFLAVGVLFWQGQIEARQDGVAAMAGALIATIWCGFLGALLTFAPAALYGTSLPDQQLAGLIMWVPCGFVYLGGALAAFASWAFRPGRAAAP